ncbi:MAG TPA: hypothetical protein VN703_07885 [Candidatus Sulfopaludibacter sp.]|nr:hypothetical protein [Candidatus Sulfopaludibacter sp.]
MKIGNYEIPDIRLSEAIQDVKKIFDKVKNTQDLTHYSDIAVMLDYKSKIGGAFYRRLNSLTLFGLLEGRAKYRVTELGENISYPINENQKSELSSKAFLNVPLWNKLYSKHGKQLSDNVWFDIKNITGISAPESQALEKEVRKWYLEDVVFMMEKLTVRNGEQNGSIVEDSTNSNVEYDTNNHINKNEPKIINHDTFAINETILEKIPFGRDIIIYLPKGNIVKSWEKAQRYMELYLEDYVDHEQPSKTSEIAELGNVEGNNDTLQKS